MRASDDPIIRQFLAGRRQGPIGMDEMADSDDAVSVRTGAAGPLARTGLEAGPIPTRWCRRCGPTPFAVSRPGEWTRIHRTDRTGPAGSSVPRGLGRC